jgi:hypothetical protein
MYIWKKILQVAGLIFAVWLLAGCGSAPASATQKAVNFTGHWEDVSSSFSLDLVQNGTQLQGGHEAVVQQGNKIDALEQSIDGKVNGQVATVTFQSSFASEKGEAQVSFIDQNTIFWKITKSPGGEFYLPAQATLVKKEATSINSSLATPAPSGVITGKVHLQGPPTPKMIVYAVDPATGAYAFAETEQTDGEAPFSITVPPGSYQVFGAVDGQPSVSVGYSLDSLTLSTVAVAAGQTVSNIEVRPPSQSDCGAMMGYPASPDGRFAAMAGPTAECLQKQAQPPAQPQANATRIQFQPNAVSWQTPGDLAPNSAIRFVLGAQKGQILTAELTLPDLGAGPAATLYIIGADGQVLNSEIRTKWTGVLVTTQDYYIEIRSLSQQAINYSLLVAIPAIGSTPYVPVTPEVCKMLQDMATQAIPTAFTMEANAAFTAPLTGEAGNSCNLTAHGTGVNFSDPVTPVKQLVSAFQGFTEDPKYLAGGPTGYATAVTRDMALVIIGARWTPAAEANCPSDQPISACNLKPEQKLYTIQIQAAMK